MNMKEKLMIQANKIILKFTLIELLVVISIITILVAILLPSLNKVREKSKLINCKVRLKQYSVAHVFYQGDNGDVMIPWETYRGTTRVTRWGGMLINYNPSVVNWATYLPKSVAACPTFADQSGATMTYGYNNSLTAISSYVAIPRKINTIRNPAHVIEFFCNYRASGNGPNNSYGTYYFYGIISPVGGDYAKMPHSQAVNFTFLDGHVDSLPLNFLIAHALSDQTSGNMTCRAVGMSFDRNYK